MAISIHAPRAGSDHADVMHWFPIHDFNPRSPCGERPLSITGARRTDPYFNPRSPCGERRSDGADLLHEGSISIHAPRAGSDLNRHCGYEMADDISIHAPRAGSDRPLLERTNIMAISIHAPRAGSDLLFECIIPREMSFQSTLPVRGATLPGMTTPISRV